MYEDYWGFHQRPFHEKCAVECSYRNEVFQSALLKLHYVLKNDLGIGVLTSESGCGKTYLLRVLVQELSAEFGPVIRVGFPQMNSRELLSFITAELLGQQPEDATGLSLDRTLRQLRDGLVKLTKDGRHPVILIDDAQVIESTAVFESLQLLLNLRSSDAAAFTMILSGEPQLIPRLLRQRSLASRIPIRAVLYPFTAEETAEYVELRLRHAGATREIFEPTALQAVFQLTGGVPLLINHLCDLSLLVGFADRTEVIGAEQVRSIADELPILAGRDKAA